MISSITVLFKPLAENFQNIESYLSRVDLLYLVDNTPGGSMIPDWLLRKSKVIILSSSVNLGIADAYNLALKRAVSDGCKWLMTMDQDSYFKPEQIDRFFNDFFRSDHYSLGIYAPLHNKKFIAKKSEKTVTVVMSSGSIVNVGAAVKAGLFDSSLYIDEVDHEMSLRLQRKGYSVLQNRRAYLSHLLGRIEDGITYYSATRLYYMTRNNLYLGRLYREDYPDYFAKRDRYMRRFLLSQVIRHRNRFQRSLMVFAGVRDYYLGRMGKRYEF